MVVDFPLPGGPCRMENTDDRATLTISFWISVPFALPVRTIQLGSDFNGLAGLASKFFSIRQTP